MESRNTTNGKVKHPLKRWMYAFPEKVLSTFNDGQGVKVYGKSIIYYSPGSL